jgi:hypothetical protein
VAPTARLSGTAHAVRAPQIRTAYCVVSGRLPAESIRRVVRDNFGRFRACYEDGLRRRGPTLAGRVATRFVIGRDGLVLEASDAGSEVADRDVVSCITTAFRGLQFAKPEGGIVTVVYPLVLQPPGTENDLEVFKEPGLASPGRPNSPFRWIDPAPPPPPLPWAGDYAEVREAFARDDLQGAFTIAAAARTHDGGDVLALLALGEAYEGAHLPALAARAYGSIADLRPNDAPMLRLAAARLRHVGDETLALETELLRRAADDRPDHPHGRHAYAMALLRSGAYAEAFDVLVAAISTAYEPRYGNARLVLEDDLALVGAAWRAAAPSLARSIEQRTRAVTGPAPTDGPSVSFVLSWETDASDVDLFVRDATRGPDEAVALVGSQRTHASDGYGPEALSVVGERGARPAGRLVVRLARKGPMGHVMGVVDVIDRDALGHVTVTARPFVVMNEGAEVDLGAFD